MRQPVTQSELSTFSRCEERHNLRYNKCLVPMEEHPALRMGSAVHRGLEHRSVSAALEELRGEDPMWTLFEGREARIREATVSAIVGGALERWSEWPEINEMSFSVPLRNPATGYPSRRCEYHGVLDGVWKGTHPDFPGEVVLGEWKTAAQVTSEYMQRLEIDFQVSAYCWASSQLFGVPVRKVVYRVIKKPTIRQKKTEDLADYIERLRSDYLERPDHYYFDTVVTRTKEQLDDWARQAWATHRRVLEIRNGAVAIRSTQSCLNRGRCPYFDLCVGAVGENAYRKLDVKHPELGAKA